MATCPLYYVCVCLVNKWECWSDGRFGEKVKGSLKVSEINPLKKTGTDKVGEP